MRVNGKCLTILAAFFSLISACARTSSTTTVTTTAASITTTTAASATTTTTEAATTTTTAATTTTTTASGCTGCSASSIDIDTADPANGYYTPVTASGSLQGGCSTLVISCTPGAAGDTESLLTFQNGLGGPAPGNPSTATLVCNSQGQWIYTNSGISTAITEAYCLG